MICNVVFVVFWGTLLRPTAGALVLIRKCTTLQSVPQMLPVPGGRVKYLLENKYSSYFEYSPYFGLWYCEYCEYSKYFGPLHFRILPYSQYFGVRYCGYSLYLNYIGVRYSWILSVLEAFRGLVLLILWVLAVSNFSWTCTVFSENELYVDRLRTFDNFIPFFGRKSSQTVPRVLVGANYFSGEQLEYSTVPAVFWEYIVRVLAVFRGSVLRILSILPRISGFDTADTPVLAVLLLLILPVLAVFRSSVLLMPPVLAARNVLDTPSTLEIQSILGATVTITKQFHGGYRNIDGPHTDERVHRWMNGLRTQSRRRNHSLATVPFA